MIALLKTPKYQRERNTFVKNSIQRSEKLIKTLGRFVHNPNHPSLNLEKLGGTKTWTIRIDKGSRIFFTWLDEKSVLLMDIGKHDKYRKY